MAMITSVDLTIAYTSLPSTRLRFYADDLVMIDVTSIPGASSTITSVFTEPAITCLTVPFRALRALRNANLITCNSDVSR